MLKTNKHKISESEFWKKTPIKTIAGCICLAFSVLVGIYFGTTSPFSIIFSILCLFLAIGFFVAEIFIRAKHMYDEKLSVTAADEKYFEDAEVIPVFSTEKMFRSATERSELSFQTHDCESSTPFDVSPDYTSELLNVVNEFVLFAEENGCKIDISTAKSILASIASSRILVVKDMQKSDFEALVGVLCTYFGTNIYIDQVNETYKSESALLFEDNDKSQKKSLMFAIEAARAQQQKLHFIALTDVAAANVENYFIPMVNYAKTPQSIHSISVTRDNAVDKHYLPENLWCILHLAEGESAASLPEALLEVCSTKALFVSVCDKAESFTQVPTVTYPQMELMIDKLKCNIPEKEWKKLDAFIGFLNQSLPVSISNKQWIGMEKYIAVLMECKENASLALDEGIATRIIPTILAKASKAKKKADIIAGLNATFESSEILASRKAAKSLTTADFV